MTEINFNYPYYWRTLSVGEREAMNSLQRLCQVGTNIAVKTGLHILETSSDFPQAALGYLRQLQSTRLSFQQIPVEVRGKQVDILTGLSSHNPDIVILHAAIVPIALNALKNLKPSKLITGYNTITNEWVKL